MPEEMGPLATHSVPIEDCGDADAQSDLSL